MFDPCPCSGCQGGSISDSCGDVSHDADVYVIGTARDWSRDTGTSKRQRRDKRKHAAWESKGSESKASSRPAREMKAYILFFLDTVPSHECDRPPIGA